MSCFWLILFRVNFVHSSLSCRYSWQKKTTHWLGLPVFVDNSSNDASCHKTLWHCMQGQCIDLPPDSAPWLYAVAGPPTMANEQSISLRCLCIDDFLCLICRLSCLSYALSCLSRPCLTLASLSLPKQL